jgi:hypothetical protein
MYHFILDILIKLLHKTVKLLAALRFVQDVLQVTTCQMEYEIFYRMFFQLSRMRLNKQ